MTAYAFLPIHMRAYISGLVELDQLDESIGLVGQVLEMTLARFHQANIRLHQTRKLVDEFPSQFNDLLHVRKSDSGFSNVMEELAIWIDLYGAIADQSTAKSATNLDALRGYAAALSSFDLSRVFHLDSEGVQKTMSSINQFLDDTSVLSPESRKNIEFAVAKEIFAHAEAHLSELLDSSRHETVDLLKRIASSDAMAIENVHRLVDAVIGVNSQIEQQCVRARDDLAQIRINPCFPAIVMGADRAAFADLENALPVPTRERDLAAVNATAIEIVRRSIRDRFSELRHSDGIMKLLGADAGARFLQMDGPSGWAEILPSIESATRKVDSLVTAGTALIQESIVAVDTLIAENMFIGDEAYSFLSQLSTRRAEWEGAKRRLSVLWAPQQAARVAGFFSSLREIDQLLSSLVQNATSLPLRTRALLSSRMAYDVPNVVEWGPGRPHGLRTRVYGDDFIWHFPIDSGARDRGDEWLDTGKSICIVFPVGVVPVLNFAIELTPESILGDWLRWVAGGFMFRSKPGIGLSLPAMPARISDFLRVHVFSQWTGNVSLQEIVIRANAAARINKGECERFFAQVRS